MKNHDGVHVPILNHRSKTHLPAKVYCDSNLLGQLLHNLLKNAIEFTERGEVVVEVDRYTISTRPALGNKKPTTAFISSLPYAIPESVFRKKNSKPCLTASRKRTGWAAPPMNEPDGVWLYRNI